MGNCSSNANYHRKYNLEDPIRITYDNKEIGALFSDGSIMLKDGNCVYSLTDMLEYTYKNILIDHMFDNIHFNGVKYGSFRSDIDKNIKGKKRLRYIYSLVDNM